MHFHSKEENFFKENCHNFLSSKVPIQNLYTVHNSYMLKFIQNIKIFMDVNNIAFIISNYFSKITEFHSKKCGYLIFHQFMAKILNIIV